MQARWGTYTQFSLMSSNKTQLYSVTRKSWRDAQPPTYCAHTTHSFLLFFLNKRWMSQSSGESYVRHSGPRKQNICDLNCGLWWWSKAGKFDSLLWRENSVSTSCDTTGLLLTLLKIPFADWIIVSCKGKRNFDF